MDLKILDNCVMKGIPMSMLEKCIKIRCNTSGRTTADEREVNYKILKCKNSVCL